MRLRITRAANARKPVRVEEDSRESESPECGARKKYGAKNETNGPASLETE
jgi:hypothetical protein